MKAINICILDDLEQVDIENDQVDVFVETDDGYSYTISFATPKYLQFLMDHEKIDYCGPGSPFNLVNKLTPEIIEEAVKDLIEDYEGEGYWLKTYDFAGGSSAVDESIFDQIKANQIKRDKEVDELDEDQLKEAVKKIEQLFRDTIAKMDAEKPEKTFIFKLSVNTDLMRKAKKNLEKSVT